MLNELWALHQSLASCGIAPEKLHPAMKDLRRGEGLIAGIDEQGHVASIEYADRERCATLWKYQPHNQRSFPAVNLHCPLWLIDPACEELQEYTATDKKDVQGRLQHLEHVGKAAKSAYTENHKTQLWARLHEVPYSLLQNFPDEEPRYAALPALLHRLANAEEYPASSGASAHGESPHWIDSFIGQLAKAALQTCRLGRLPRIDILETLLLGSWDSRNKRYKATEINLFLDLADHTRFECRVASPEMGRFFNRKLLAHPIGDTGDTGICALTGEQTEIEKVKFPQPRLPIIGNTYLFAMNRDAPCHYRYGLIATSIFPTGKRATKQIHDAVRWITQPERRGKTWQAVPHHRREKQRQKNDLLIVYLEDNPVTEANLAALFSEPGEVDDVQQGLYEGIAASVCKALEMEAGITPASSVRLIVISILDEGRRQVLLNSSFSVERVRLGVSDWRDGAANHPPVTLLLPGQRGQPAVSVQPSCPSPAQAMRCLQRQWVRFGAESTSVPGCNLYVVYDVLLGDGEQASSAALTLLQMALPRATPLLIGVGLLMQGQQANALSPDARRAALTHVALFAILLHKLERRKEVYMNEAAFNLGRLCALADTLHKEYCKGPRKGEIPSRLIGNATMPVALERPNAALARLSERITVYQAWANTAEGQDVGLAKWALKQIGIVTSKLKELDIPIRCDDPAKAEMLLGYLCRPESD